MKHRKQNFFLRFKLGVSDNVKCLLPGDTKDKKRDLFEGVYSVRSGPGRGGVPSSTSCVTLGKSLHLAGSHITWVPARTQREDAHTGLGMASSM